MAEIHRPSKTSVVNVHQVDILLYDSLNTKVILGYGSGLSISVQRDEYPVVTWSNHLLHGFSPGVARVSGQITSFVTSDDNFASILRSALPNWPLKVPRYMNLTVSMQENSENPGKLIAVATDVVLTGHNVSFQPGNIAQDSISFNARMFYDVGDAAKYLGI